MKQIKKILIVAFALILCMAAVGCTGKDNTNNNTTGGALGAGRTNSATDQYNMTDQYNRDRYGTDYTTPYQTNSITNNTRTTAGAIGTHNNGIADPFMSR